MQTRPRVVCNLHCISTVAALGPTPPVARRGAGCRGGCGETAREVEPHSQAPSSPAAIIATDQVSGLPGQAPGRSAWVIPR